MADAELGWRTEGDTAWDVDVPDGSLILIGDLSWLARAVVAGFWETETRSAFSLTDGCSADWGVAGSLALPGGVLIAFSGLWACRWKVLYNGLRIANAGGGVKGLLGYRILRL